jgi:ribulose-bisphosphate carboxylase large chain
MHVNGLANKFCEPDDSVIASARSLLTPLFADRPDVAMPVFSSGQTAVQVHESWARLGSADLIYAAGGGIMAHPGGPAAGVESIRAAWDGAMRGETQGETARGNAAFARALQAFG